METLEQSLTEQINKLPYENHACGKYNDDMIVGFEMGARWAAQYVLQDAIEKMKQLSNNYQVLNGQYVISKNVFDVFIEQFE